MKVIKPQKLSVLTRCFEYRQQFRLGVSLFAFVPLTREAELLPEVAMWPFAIDEIGKDVALEAGIPKSHPEFLVTGRAYVPGDDPQPACSVTARLGEIQKSLYVFGDREWRGTRFTDPAPFKDMPLDWAHAYGGEGYAANPLGKGAAPIEVDGRRAHPLPNIEYPAQALTAPSQRPQPAGFAPIDQMWPQRADMVGTYDQAWLEQDFPGFAADMDLRFFNLTAQDQHLPQALRGDEEFALENLHPDMPLIEGQLPGLVARCYVDRSSGDGVAPEEVPTTLRTVWFFPHADRMILIYQGTTKINEDDGADITRLMIAAERMGEAKGDEHYRRVMAERLDKEKGHLLALRDSDLLPGGMAGAGQDGTAIEFPSGGEGILNKHLRARLEREINLARDYVAERGMDPDIHAPPPLPPEEPLPTLEEIPEYIERLQADAERRKQEEAERDVARDEEVRKTMEEAGLDFDDILAERTATPRGPPTFTAQGQVDELRRLADKLSAQGIPIDELEQMLGDEEKLQQWRDLERVERENYRKIAHHQTPAFAMEIGRTDAVRAELSAALAAGRPLSNADLTGANLANMDLRGIDLENAFLESVDFENANLEGANLKGAVLAHASLKGANFTSTNLSGANLGAANLAKATLQGADLRMAILAKAELTGADFRRTQMGGADCSEAVFGHADFSGAEANEVIFLDADLRGVRMVRTQLKQSSFLRANVCGVDFSEAMLESAVFLSAKGRKARFRGAKLINARFVEECDFASADFIGADLSTANLRGSLLAEADFTEANLDKSDLSGCDLREARLYRASAVGALLLKTNLAKSTMTSINLMGALLTNADIRGADLRGSNLFQSDLARVYRDSDTRFEQSDSTRARTYPRRAS